MDNEQAKFLLQSFRPDGADAGAEEFAEALKLAAEDRELGEWLAQERADDAAFAKALNEIEIPESLREEILSVLEHDGDQLPIDDDFESLFAGGLDNITPPPGLRDQILASMEVEKAAQRSEVEDAKVTDISAWRWLSVAGLAAALAVGVFVTTQRDDRAGNDALAKNGSGSVAPAIGQQVAVHYATQQMASMLKDPALIGLNTEMNQTVKALSFLEENKSPVPSKLPPGLEDAKLVGCKNVFLENGLPVSLMCFEKEGVGMIHLIALDKKMLSDSDELSSIKNISLKNCYSCKRTSFNIAHWNDGDITYMILTKAEREQMVELF